jgi:hypothetical protein
MSPFTIGTSFDDEVTRIDHKYRRGDFPVRLSLPKAVNSIEGGLVIDLPDEKIEEYLKKTLDLDEISTDEYLISFLETQINTHLNKKKYGSNHL